MSTTYYYNGRRTPAGNPMETLQGVPARDLDEADVARLSDDQVDSLATKGADGNQLYTKSKPASKPAKGSANAGDNESQ